MVLWVREDYIRKSQNGFLYLKFNKIDIEKKKASISLDNTWAIADTSIGTYLSCGGMVIKFRKFRGMWIEDKKTSMDIVSLVGKDEDLICY